MNEKQVKLLRYFTKASGDLSLAAAAMARWDTMNHRKKGKLARWLKKVTVTMLALKDTQKREQLEKNKKILDSFITSQ